MEFLREKHIAYLNSLEDDKEKTMSSFRAESIRMGGIYWGLSSMLLLGIDIKDSQRERLRRFILSCFSESQGGFGWSSGHDAHLTSTHYAVLVFEELGLEFEEEMKGKIMDFVSANQNPDGSFQCDRWGESDLRFAYDAVCVLSLLDKTGWKSRINFAVLIDWVYSCQNIGDGGFGPNPGLESHAAYTFCAVGALRIAGDNNIREKEKLARWLSERQTFAGGFNGRPEKAPDVCYSWWILSSLAMLNKSHWIDKEALAKFILRSQEKDRGGIAARPDCVADVFHTFFGLAGLSLIDREKFGLGETSLEYAIARGTNFFR